jgi:hypothetical protein
MTPRLHDKLDAATLCGGVCLALFLVALAAHALGIALEPHP